MITPDIKKKVEIDFGLGRSASVLSNIEGLVERFYAQYRKNPSARMIRCILHLAEGKEEEVTRLIEATITDWRDVILWAEHDEKDNRIFNGVEMFSFSE